MVKLRDSDVERVAKLANLVLTKEEVKKFKEELSQVLGYINSLEEVEVLKTKPTSQTTGLVDVTRKDKLNELACLTQEEALFSANKTQNNFFVAKHVFGDEKQK
ncbi:MAG: Glutamyl-tRNA(Gln) amidotransferase subunit C [Candidatus Woesebacteria bacterium GW2011_GWC1_43_10b]|uniref:Aspartyl/glutamyl-tRNA(Asn/Gln) amidotransferase subunit C n=2 Tax=Candidatus Woeseibacteriota TaxID=1752722 RepID=A0A0G1GFF5_9BACT|nr:MAG: Glutamyl-tRNA(Gln) amidotransferase subunit C [Candidatus Woesebacteria bacterium GW2011_GWC1_43_10b]KKT33255.1 MAG: Aspartyl/glutamyl-tRNA(Asn/Gln) amidotransferase subunit C [Candidatus Woesebacteria bacterium GW2011_GWB1_44_11b]